MPAPNGAEKKSFLMVQLFRRPILPVLACLALLVSTPTVFAARLPTQTSDPIAVIIPSSSSPSKHALRRQKAGFPRLGIRRASRDTTKIPYQADGERADRMARQSLTLGITSLAAIMLGWVPVAGWILALAAVPLSVLALVKGYKAKKSGSEKTTGVVFGYISLGLFMLAMIAAVLFIAAFVLLWGI